MSHNNQFRIISDGIYYRIMAATHMLCAFPWKRKSKSCARSPNLTPIYVFLFFGTHHNELIVPNASWSNKLIVLPWKLKSSVVKALTERLYSFTTHKTDFESLRQTVSGEVGVTKSVQEKVCVCVCMYGPLTLHEWLKWRTRVKPLFQRKKKRKRGHLEHSQWNLRAHLRKVSPKSLGNFCAEVQLHSQAVLW